MHRSVVLFAEFKKRLPNTKPCLHAPIVKINQFLKDMSFVFLFIFDSLAYGNFFHFKPILRSFYFLPQLYTSTYIFEQIF